MTSYTKTQSTHIYKTASGSYRFRAKVNGKTHSKNFKTLKEARAYKAQMVK
jgi:hypothetical protein